MMHGITATDDRAGERPHAPPQQHEEPTTQIDTIREANMLSRFLYPNPVCLLTVRKNITSKKRNMPKNVQALDEATTRIMTISWLTAVDNLGTFFMSMNKSRHTAKSMAPGSVFVLSVPSAALQKTVVDVGSVSGSTCTDKLAHLGIETCVPGWFSANVTA
jgi:hypothetical protein